MLFRSALAPQPLGIIRRARHGERDEVRHRGAADEQPARARGHAHDLPAPVDDLRLDEVADVVAAAEMAAPCAAESALNDTELIDLFESNPRKKKPLTSNRRK